VTGGGAIKSYVGGIEYSGVNLEAIYHGEGRLTPNGSNFWYEYVLKDHLGNSRISWRAITSGTAVQVLQENHYYPFGLEMEGAWVAQTGTENAYQYNGKEINEDFGLNLSDYGARWYDGALGRWWSVDPLGEKTPRWSPYHYGFNNPLRFVDPTGMASEAYSIIYKTQEYTAQYEQTHQNSGASSGSGGSTFGADGSMHLEGADAQNWFAGQQRAAQSASLSGIGFNDEGKVIYNDGSNSGNVYFFPTHNGSLMKSSKEAEGIPFIKVIGGGKWVSTSAVFHRCFTAFACGEGMPTDFVSGAKPITVSMINMRFTDLWTSSHKPGGNWIVMPNNSPVIEYTLSSSIYAGSNAFYQYWSTCVHELMHVKYAIKNPNGFIFKSQTELNIWNAQDEIDTYEYQKMHRSFDRLHESNMETFINNKINFYKNEIKRFRKQ
jgi:RHS repeat-associated protein